MCDAHLDAYAYVLNNHKAAGVKEMINFLFVSSNHAVMKILFVKYIDASNVLIIYSN